VAGNSRGQPAVLPTMPATAAHLLCLRDGERLTARAIRPDDKDALVAFFARLSPESRRRRFLAPKPRLTTRDLVSLTEVDGRTHVALVALDRDGAIVGVARYAAWRDRPERADVAFAVADDWHGRGLGTVLGDRLVEHARRSGLTALTGSTLGENGPARSLLRRLGFRPVGHSSGVADYELPLAVPAAPPLPAAA
jgi:RimJ/RimL family protein N-acetyltransferase